MRIFHASEGRDSLDCLAVAWAVFELEKGLREKGVRGAAIGLPFGPVRGEAAERLAVLLNELLSFTLVSDVDFVFRRGKSPRVRKLTKTIDLRAADKVCLFSGGVDSYVGLSLALKRDPTVNALFCAHEDQSKINGIVHELYRREFERRGVVLRQLSVPGVGKQGYAQTRGFLYFVGAAAWMQLLNASTLVITECGPTMYQPKFGPLDRVTMTTHPFVVETARQVIELLLGRAISISIPFENLTKAEVMALAPRGPGLRLTHSCISQRFGTHDGTCYGCVVRRLAGLAAGVPDVSYQKDPLLDEGANRGNLLALLRFSLDFLGYRETMEEYEIGEIQAYGKEDLFRRFALDNLAAVHRLAKARRPLASDVKRVYGYAIEALGGPEPLEQRLDELKRSREQHLSDDE